MLHNDYDNIVELKKKSLVVSLKGLEAKMN
jgi:hypothetical protein